MNYSELRTDLGRKKHNFLTAIKGIESLDEEPYLSLFHDNSGRKADFVTSRYSLVIELKEIIVNRSEELNEWLNKRTATDDALAGMWAGRVHVDELIRKHPKSKVFEQEMIHFIFKNLKRDVLRCSCKQIKNTKDTLPGYAYGMLSLVVTNEGALTREGLEEYIEWFLSTEPELTKHIDIYSILVGRSEFSFANSELSFYVNRNKPNQENLEGLRDIIISNINSKYPMPQTL